MIQKPTAEWSSEGEGARKAQAAVSDGMKSLAKSAAVVQHGAKTVQGYVGIAFGGLWIVAGVAAGLGGSIPTLFGAGLMGAGAIWIGKRRIRNGRTAVREALGLPAVAAPTPGAASTPGPTAARASAPIADTPVRDPLAPAFDADAIIARHLAERELAEQMRLVAPAHVEPVPMNRPGVAARAAFGRKVA